ncbi:MAG TPA: MIP/aquaporin family protein [Blastocatellia bacterium]|nr:MIP/aquaporin family protein [Blastocatellia bacterium]
MEHNTLKRELFAEFLGTLVLITFGTAVVAQVLLSREKNGQYLSINLAWGLGVTMAVYVAGGVTGAHLNPAVTLAMAMRRALSWRKVLPYWVAQTAGAFAGAAVTFLLYRDAFNAFDGGTRQMATAGIFATYPQPYLSTVGGLLDQIIGTAFLLLVICATGDARNLAPSGNLGPLIVGLLVVLIGMTMGFNCGYAINPARDLGPRLFTLVAGWGSEVFRAGNYWFWVPLIGPLIGGVLGARVYDLMIGRYLPKQIED